MYPVRTAPPNKQMQQSSRRCAGFRAGAVLRWSGCGNV